MNVCGKASCASPLCGARFVQTKAVSEGRVTLLWYLSAPVSACVSCPVTSELSAVLCSVPRSPLSCDSLTDTAGSKRRLVFSTAFHEFKARQRALCAALRTSNRPLQAPPERLSSNSQRGTLSDEPHGPCMRPSSICLCDSCAHGPRRAGCSPPERIPTVGKQTEMGWRED